MLAERSSYESCNLPGEEPGSRQQSSVCVIATFFAQDSQHLIAEQVAMFGGVQT